MPRTLRARIVRRTLLAMALAAVGMTSAALDSARADYPERQVTMIVCFPAGGGTDIAARLINTQLGEALGKPVIVENRGGAGGNIGIAAARARAATATRCWSARAPTWSIRASMPRRPTTRSRISSRSW